MKKEIISEALGKIGDKYVFEAAEFETRAATPVPPKPLKTRKIKWTIIAACVALAVAAGSAVAAFAYEARAYGEATAFFDENGLSTEGLTRADVKAVYRDITSGSFTYGKTAEVIGRTVPGYNIAQQEPTPEELAVMWDKNVWSTVSIKGVSYRKDSSYILDEQTGIEKFEKSVLECCVDGEPVWRAEFRHFDVLNYAYTTRGTAVWGWSYDRFDFDNEREWFARVDEDGSVLWERFLSHGLGREWIVDILDNEDGTWTVVSFGDYKYLCFNRYDMNGNEIAVNRAELGRVGIIGAARLGDGYIVQVSDSRSPNEIRLLKFDGEGKETGVFTYTAEDCDYYLSDMVEFGGQIYLSAYSVPKQTDPGGRSEIADLLRKLYSIPESWNTPSEELTALVRENYTAVLLICDPDGGAPETFYSVKGSLGGDLHANGDRLEWNVKSVTSTFFSPLTNSFTIGGICRIFRYTFGTDGTLIGQEDTGETEPYRR